MILISTITLLLIETGFLTVMYPAVSMEVQPGLNVTMWCEHTIYVSGNLYWFKQEAGAVPIIIVNMLYTESLQSVKPQYFNNFTKDHLIMHQYSKTTSLTIMNVSVSDSGIYFCGTANYHMKFGNGTTLEVKDKKIMSKKNDTERLKKDHDKFPVSTKGCSEGIFFILTFLFGGIIILTFNILLILAIIRQNKRQRQRKVPECQAQQHDYKEPESVEYAAVHFSKMKRRTAEQTDTIVAYTDTT